MRCLYIQIEISAQCWISESISAWGNADLHFCSLYSELTREDVVQWPSSHSGVGLILTAVFSTALTNAAVGGCTGAELNTVRKGHENEIC